VATVEDEFALRSFRDKIDLPGGDEITAIGVVVAAKQEVPGAHTFALRAEGKQAQLVAGETPEQIRLGQEGYVVVKRHCRRITKVSVRQ
jgi:hypothetical protein